MLFGKLTNGTEFRLLFQHGGKSHRWTRCSLELLHTDGKTVTGYMTGYAGCHSSDRFSKAEGRRKALINMFDTPEERVECPHLPKEDRRTVWETYHSRGQ